MSMPVPPLRTYQVSATTTSTFGRVRAAVRDHELTIDGPKHNGAPGDRPTPGEMMLTAAAACGAEVLQVLARDAGVPFTNAAVDVTGTINLEEQPVPGVTVFSSVLFEFRLCGPSHVEARNLIEGFQRRCPVYGTLAVASGRVDVRFTTESEAAPVAP
jgi:uncharacterized OsmC-like protein